MTYNIRHGWGIKSFFGLKDILSTIKHHKPDIIGLNEVDKYNPRSLFVDQAKNLANRLKYFYAFEPNLKIGPIGYGNAILTKYPILGVQNYSLFSKVEPRSCLSVILDVLNGNQGGKIRVLCTHLGLIKSERKKQIDQLVEIIKEAVMPTLLIGDFNCVYNELGPLKEVLFDTISHNDDKINQNTYPSNKPIKRLDYIFHNFGFNNLKLNTIFSDASDHLPVIANMELVKGSKNV